MPDLPDRKAGIIACSGEEIAEGTVSRLAALNVLQELRPRDTVTICLPLFLAGGEGDRAFARFHPTIAVDGCELRCAARATEKYSGKPAASVVVSEIVAECGTGKPQGKRRLNQAGQRAVEATAQRVATLVDEVLGGGAKAARDAKPDQRQGAGQATCACGSALPVQTLVIDGHAVEVVALPLIFEQFRKAGRGHDDLVIDQLMETVKVCNQVPPESEAAYRQAICRAYAAYCEQEMTR